MIQSTAMLWVFSFLRRQRTYQVSDAGTQPSRISLTDTADSLLGGVPEHDLVTPFHDAHHFAYLRDTHTTINPPSFVDDFFNDEAFPKDVLDFGIDFAFGSPIVLDPALRPLGQDLSTSAMNHQEADSGAHRSGVVTPGLKGKLNIMASTKAFKESLWLWTPERSDHVNLEQRNLSLPLGNVPAGGRNAFDQTASQRKLSGTARGKILAMVLQTCEQAMYSHIVSNFPSSDLLTQLIHEFTSFHSRSELPWIHLPTIELENERPEFLGGMIAYGAVLSPEYDIRRLGFAFQEALRMALPIEVRQLSTTTDLC